MSDQLTVVLRTTSTVIVIALLVGAGATLASSAQPAEIRTEVAHLVGTRTAFQVCVDVDGETVSRREVADVVRSVIRSELRTHPGWRRSAVDPGAITIAEGCPYRSLALAAGFTHPSARNAIYTPRRPASPSPFTTHVYVTTAAEVERIFSGVPVVRRTLPEEFICETGGACGEVTTSVIIDLQTLRDRASLARWLRAGLHLERPK